MASASSSPSPPPPPTADEPNQEHQPPQQQPQAAPVKEKECVHRTKTIQFLNRTTPIVLQNDNGPCPLLAICNVLLLRNNLNLSPDISEVSQEKLLSLVAERLIDSNSNVNNKDAGYVENQQQNIADAIDLLPRLATGIDVNIKFRRIDDFEFTPECAIFDLLDIPLYHGWIVDPQDYDTANAIGSKSYNALVGELVALETQNMDSESKNNPEEDCVDFAAATTATLGVPSPCLSKSISFEDSPRSVSDHQNARKGDLEEEAELLRALKLSEAELPTTLVDSLSDANNSGVVSSGSDESTSMKTSVPADSLDAFAGHIGLDMSRDSLSSDNNNLTPSVTILGETACSMSKMDQINYVHPSTYTESVEHVSCNDVMPKSTFESVDQIEGAMLPTHAENTSSMYTSIEGEKAENPSALTANFHEVTNVSSGHDTAEVTGLSSANLESDSSSAGVQNTDAPDNFTSSVDGSEPIYEGEECIFDVGTTSFEDREPMYEGEVILAEQADKSVRSKDEITPQQGELIKNFLKNTASQLTFYGLFCLQDGLKERELCVFFRNNHFSTMFKYDGELYLLATDQGYLNQPGLVWEKLNEVNGDTLFMTSNFKEFKVENHTNETWNENNAMASTADYLASIDTASHAGLDINSDLQLAIALQQQEFEQQQQPQHHVVPQQPAGSKLITGPRVPSTSSSSGRHSSSSSSRAEAKSKEKCIVM